MPLLTRTLALVAIVVAALLGAGGFAALAQSTQSTQRAAGGPRATLAAPTPPPLPLGDASRTGQSTRRSGNDVRRHGCGDRARASARFDAHGRGRAGSPCTPDRVRRSRR